MEYNILISLLQITLSDKIDETLLRVTKNFVRRIV